MDKKLQEIEYKLERLREEFKAATISRRHTILLQARALKWAKEAYMKKNHIQEKLV